MADDKKSEPKKVESKKVESAKVEPKASSTPSSSPKSEGINGKGDAPRNCFTEEYRSNFDSIDWSK